MICANVLSILVAYSQSLLSVDFLLRHPPLPIHPWPSQSVGHEILLCHSGAHGAGEWELPTDPPAGATRQRCGRVERDLRGIKTVRLFPVSPGGDGPTVGRPNRVGTPRSTFFECGRWCVTSGRAFLLPVTPRGFCRAFGTRPVFASIRGSLHSST